MRRMMLLPLVGLVLLGACGRAAVEATTTVSPTTTQVATTTTTLVVTTTVPPTTTTTVDVMAQARAYYLDIVHPGNCLIDRYDAAYDSIADEEGFIYPEDWPRVREDLLPIEAAIADAEVAFMEALATYGWPAEVQAEVDALIPHLAEVASLSQSSSESESFDAWVLIVYPDDNPAAVLRARLGLPTNIGETEAGC